MSAIMMVVNTQNSYGSKVISITGPATGNSTSWTSNTVFLPYPNASGTTTSDYAGSTDNPVWQLFFAWVNLKIVSGATYGALPYASGTNSIVPYYSISSSQGTIGNFSSAASFGTAAGGSYSAGVFKTGTTNTTINISANTYFVLGINDGPYYQTYKTASQNQTAYISGSPIVTAINKAWISPWPSGPTSGLPSQLGGPTSGYTEIDGYMWLTEWQMQTA